MLWRDHWVFFKTDYQYQKLRLNVDMLKIIQLGLTFADPDGQLERVSTWQFNFKFNIHEDTYAQDSIELLQGAGIEFARHLKDGIDVHHFAELLTSSGVVLNDQVKWITFHSGYDFGYLLKILTCKPLPEKESEFFDLLNRFFPCIYDLKVLTNTRRGLNQVAEEMQVNRVGPNHQAGSDSLLTCGTFFMVRRKTFGGHIDDRYVNQICGLGEGAGRFGETAYSPEVTPASSPPPVPGHGPGAAGPAQPPAPSSAGGGNVLLPSGSPQPGPALQGVGAFGPAPPPGGPFAVNGFAFAPHPQSSE